MLHLHAQSSRLFFGPEGQGIARYDKPRYPIFDKLNKHMRSFNWEPEVITMAGERRSFNLMTDSEQFIFTSGLQRAIMLDTEQGRAPVPVFGSVCTDPSLENCITTWQYFETIHSESYTHILQAIYPDPSAVVNAIPGIKEIDECATQIDNAYEQMVNKPNKENLYLALIEANALESLRFFNFFATIFNFKKRLLVPGSGDVVKLIARDENVHLALVTHILKTLPKDDPEFVQIASDLREQALGVYRKAAEQEKAWAQYLFSSGPILGLNEGILCDYIDHREIKTTNAVGLTSKKVPLLNLSYMEEYVDKADKIQAAPQEDGSLEYLSAASLYNDLSTFVPKLTSKKLDINVCSLIGGV
jgi:ribonucleoside-diphosphate reductase beta chain